MPYSFRSGTLSKMNKMEVKAVAKKLFGDAASSPCLAHPIVDLGDVRKLLVAVVYGASGAPFHVQTRARARE